MRILRIRPPFPPFSSRGWRSSGLQLLLAILLLGISAGAQAEDEGGGLLNGTAKFAQEYLADKRRAGALVGSLFGTALTVHPAGSIVGSILGFWIGKATMHDDPRVLAQVRSEDPLDPRRPIAPADGSAVASLSFSAPGEVRQFEPLPSPSSPSPSVAVAAAPRSEPAPAAEGLLAMPTLAILPGSEPASPLAPLGKQLPVPPSRDQLAMLCSNGAGSGQDQRLHKACFYFQGY